MKYLLSILLAAGLAGCAHMADNDVVNESPAQGNQSLKVMSYNVLVGLDSSERRNAFIRYMNQESPDVLALQELNRINPKELRQMAGAYGHSYSVLLKRTGYPVGISSRYPIEIIRRLRAGFHHGALHVRIGDIDYIVVHFSPVSENKRIKEAEGIMDYIKDIELFPGGKVIVLGDFNARSLFDFDEYAGISGTELPENESLPENLQCLGTFYQAGFTDAYADRHAGESNISTFPTSGKGEGERIDFILASPALSASLTHSEILRNDRTELISDHFPVSAEFRTH